MDIRVLKYFLAVVQEENVTKAAEVLHTTQPNLSRQLANLEDEIGRKLFERGSRNITLTEDGMFLRKRAMEIVELMERTESELANSADVSGVIHIGAAETHTMRFLSDVMLELRNDYSQIQYDIFSGSTVEVTELLQKGLLDFAVLVAPIDLSRFDYLKLPQNDIFGLVMRNDDPLTKYDTIRPEYLDHAPVLVAKQQLESNVLSGWLGRDVSELNIVSTFNLITTPAMMVESGMGSAFTFDNLVNVTTGSELTFRPLEPKLEATLYLVWKKYQLFPRAAEMFLEQVKNRIK